MTAMEHSSVAQIDDDEGEISLSEIVSILIKSWRLVTVVPLAVAVIALAVTYFIEPTFTAQAVFLPPQPRQSVAESAVASLGALSGLAGGLAGLRTPADQYVALMKSATVGDRMIDRFGLMKVYDRKYRVEARKDLAKHTRISVGKKDGLITVEVDDHSPQRAANMANRYIDELRVMTDTIAVSEAQQRRKFFELQLQQTKQRLVAAQLALQSSGVSEAAIKADPKAAAQAYSTLRAQVTAAEVKLQAMRGFLAEGASEVQQQQAVLTSLKQQLAALAQSEPAAGAPDYVGKYREFKYQEALFDIYAKEYELARADESREGGLIQVVDTARPPEIKSSPKRIVIAAMAFLAAAVAMVLAALVRERWRGSQNAGATLAA